MAAPMTNVRVKLTLPQPTENCWFLLNTENDRVIGDIEKRLLKRFGKENHSVGLFLDDCRLPTEESTLILRDNDNISLCFSEISSDASSNQQQEFSTSIVSDPQINVKHHKKERKHKKSNRAHSDVDDDKDISFSSNQEKRHKSKHKKKRYQSDSDEKVPKKKRRSENIDLNPDNVRHVEGKPKETESECTTGTDRESSSKIVVFHSTTDVKVMSGTESPEEKEKKKRKRTRRKRKTSTKKAIHVTDLCDTPFAKKPNSQFKPIIPMTFKRSDIPNHVQQVKANGHKYFESEPENEEQSETTPSLSEVQAPSLSEVQKSSIAPENIIDPAKEWNDVSVTDTEPPVIVANEVQINGMEKAINTEIQQSLEVATCKDMHKSIEVETPDCPSKEQDESSAVQEGSTSLQTLMEEMSGYKIVPPPSDYRPANQRKNSNNKRNNSPAGLLQGAQVFNRRRCKKNAFYPLSKEEQLNTKSTNKSTVYQNPLQEKTNGDPPEEPKQPDPEPPKDYSALERLHGLPREKDRIAFKVLEMSENCTPEMSPFQEATVLRYDPVTKMVDLEMIKSSNGQRKPSRFDVLVEDDEEILTNVSDEKLKTLSWSSLVDVCLLPPS